MDGQTDTGGDPPGGTDPVRAPNPARTPYRPNGADGTGSLLPDRPVEPRPTDRPWPERATDPVPGVEPLPAPTVAPGFEPLSGPLNPTVPAEAPAPTRPQVPFDPLRPTGPGLPFAEPDDRPAGPFFIPIPFPLQPLGNPGYQNPSVPVSVPVGFRQPATTPTGSPQQLITPTTTPTTNPNVQPVPTPTPQPPRLDDKCCIPPTDQELLKRLEQIKKAIGVDGLPASVPDQIAKQNPGQKQIASLAELQLWQVEQLDGVMGRWPQQIPIPTPAGPVNIGMPNMAEAVAEMIGMMVSQQVTAAQILNTSSRAMVQAGSATQQAHLAHLTAKANADFLGYESRPEAVEMPLAYTPGKDPGDGLLNESRAKIQGFQNTDTTDIKAILAELLQAAAIIRAVYWRKLDTKGDLKSQIRENVRGHGDFLNEAAAGGSDSDWEAYLKQVEEGFRGATGDTNPYGRPPTEGPDIKDRSPKKDKK
jgi:hypothetical protein